MTTIEDIKNKALQELKNIFPNETIYNNNEILTMMNIVSLTRLDRTIKESKTDIKEFIQYQIENSKFGD